MSAPIKLYSVLGTRFVTKSLAPKIRTSIAEGSTIDLSLMRISRDAVFILDYNYNYINSEEPYLDEILKHNKHVSDVISTRRVVQLPDKFNNLLELSEYIKTMTTHTTYIVKQQPTYRKSQVITYLFLLLLLPNVKIDLGSCITNVFDYVRIHYPRELTLTHSRFMRLSGFGVVTDEFVGETIHILGEGVFEKREYLAYFNAIPVIGEIKLVSEVGFEFVSTALKSSFDKEDVVVHKLSDYLEYC